MSEALLLEALVEFGEDSPEMAHYRRCLEAGASHNVAMMLASKRPPGGSKLDRQWARMRDPEAYARGLKVTGKYQPGLARYPGDPQAVVHSRGDAKRVADRYGWKITDRPNNAESSVQRRLAEERRSASWHGNARRSTR